ncbi:MAG: IQ calmodulin-binding motif-containing protein, partial [archaeon]|nr:IQ calmodulin-binding motif-containing protein [archaeon]
MADKKTFHKIQLMLSGRVRDDNYKMFDYTDYPKETVRLQTAIRALIGRTKYEAYEYLMYEITLIQKYWRGYLARKKLEEFLNIYNKIRFLQRFFKDRYQLKQEEATKIQRQVRAFLLNLKVKKYLANKHEEERLEALKKQREEERLERERKREEEKRRRLESKQRKKDAYLKQKAEEEEKRQQKEKEEMEKLQKELMDKEAADKEAAEKAAEEEKEKSNLDDEISHDLYKQASQGSFLSGMSKQSKGSKASKPKKKKPTEFSFDEDDDERKNYFEIKYEERNKKKEEDMADKLQKEEDPQQMLKMVMGKRKFRKKEYPPDPNEQKEEEKKEEELPNDFKKLFNMEEKEKNPLVNSKAITKEIKGNLGTKYPKDFLERMELYNIVKYRNRENLKNSIRQNDYQHEPEIHNINPKVEKIFEGMKEEDKDINEFKKQEEEREKEKNPQIYLGELETEEEQRYNGSRQNLRGRKPFNEFPTEVEDDGVIEGEDFIYDKSGGKGKNGNKGKRSKGSKWPMGFEKKYAE